MIPITLFNISIAIGILLFLYAIIDYNHEFYANIIAAFVSGVTFMYCSSVVGAGGVYDVVAGAQHAITDMGSSVLLQYFADIAFVYCLLMSARAYIVYKKHKKESEVALSTTLP